MTALAKESKETEIVSSISMESPQTESAAKSSFTFTKLKPPIIESTSTVADSKLSDSTRQRSVQFQEASSKQATPTPFSSGIAKPPSAMSDSPNVQESKSISTPFGKQTSSLFGKSATTNSTKSPFSQASLPTTNNPTQPPSTSAPDQNSIISRIQEIYQTHNPHKLDEIPQLLEKYQADLPGLLARIEKKYLKPVQSTPASMQTPVNATFQQPKASSGNQPSKQSLSPFANGAGTPASHQASPWGGMKNQPQQSQQPPKWGATSTGGLFGKSSQSDSANTSFGNNSSTSPSPAFGKASTLGTGGSLFGTQQPAQTPSPFQKSNTSMMGGTNQGSGFGGKVGFGQGQSSLFGGTQNPAPQGSAGGPNQGQGFGMTSGTGSMFGQNPAQQQPGFGASQTQPTFGQNAPKQQPGFGAQSTFGRPQGSLFGGTGGQSSTYSSPGFNTMRKF